MASSDSAAPTLATAAAAAAGAPPTHVIVVGAGLAGLTAALTAAEHGARVTLLEKGGVGGNSAKATSGINAACTPAQAAAHIHDTNGMFFADTLTSGHGFCNPSLVRMLATKSHEVVPFMASHGVHLDAVSLCGGHSVPRTHHEPPRADGKPSPIGWNMVSALKRQVEAKADAITILTKARVVKLLQEAAEEGEPSGAAPVRGVQYLVVGDGGKPVTGEPVELLADAVILTTGGFGNDHSDTSLLAEFAPHLACLPTTNGAFAEGDGVKIAREAGAYLRGMRSVQVHPTGFVDPADPDNRTKFLAAEALRGHGGILLNHRGKRFVNELGRRDEVTTAMYQWCTAPGESESQGERDAAAIVMPSPVHAWLVLSRKAAASVGPNFNFYWKVKHLFTEVDGVAGLAKAMGDESKAGELADELAAYNEVAKSGESDAFGKTVFPDAFETTDMDKLYVARVTPSIHYTMGGVATNAAAELLYAEVDAGSAAIGTIVDASPSVVARDEEEQIVASATTVPETPTARLLATRSSGDMRLSAAVERASGLMMDADEYSGILDKPVLRPIPRLFGAGEVTGGVHGGNRLAGNSLLECIVFGRIAGQRAAAVTRNSAPALSAAHFTALEFRESFRVCADVFLFRFNLPSPLQLSGLSVGEYVAVSADIDGSSVVRYYSPISRPDAPGYIDLLLKVDPSGGAMTSFMNSLQPGDTRVSFKGPLGAFKIDLSPAYAPSSRIRRIGLIAGGTGIAPMSQILRSALFHKRHDIPIKLIYAASAPNQFAFLELLRRKVELHPQFEMLCTVDRVPPGQVWNGSVGFVNEALLREFMFPPGDDLQIVVCGPYPMCQSLKQILPAMGYTKEMFFSYM